MTTIKISKDDFKALLESIESLREKVAGGWTNPDDNPKHNRYKKLWWDLYDARTESTITLKLK